MLFFNPRPVAFTLKSKIETDIDCQLQLGVIEPVRTAKSGATPVVPVDKPNGPVQICGDITVTVNAYDDRQWYPLQHPDEIRAALAGNKIFVNVDLADANLQMVVDESFRKYLVLSNHKHLLR